MTYDTLLTTNKQYNILAEIVKERQRQREKWGEQLHTPVGWVVILGEEYGEVCKGYCDAAFKGDGLTHYREELIHTAAVCVAAVECLDRQTEE
jgi:uncharacterized protein YbdZ (MbtH family)